MLDIAAAAAIVVTTCLVLELLLRWLDRRFEAADQRFLAERHKDLIAYHERLISVAKGQSHDRPD